MYHPFIRQKLCETRARELERIAEVDRAGVSPQDGGLKHRRRAWRRVKIRLSFGRQRMAR